MPDKMDKPPSHRPRKRRQPKDPPTLKADEVDGIYLAAQRAGRECIEILECSGRVCRVIGTFCPNRESSS